jgi:ABC-type transport system involved in multi-copper enzyme maturation permease subunit
MLTLLKKDWRLNAIPIYGGTLLVAVPYLVVALALICQSDRDRRHWWADDLQVAAIMGTMLTVAVTAVFGGVAFAQERRERSADFLAMLPVSRCKIVLSKAIIGILFSGALWAANYAVYDKAATHGITSGSDHISILFIYALAADAMLIAFGIAWFASSFLSSPSIAACIGIGATVALGLLGMLPDRFLWQLPDEYRIGIVLTLPAMPGVLGFIGGTLHYLRRVEP